MVKMLPYNPDFEGNIGEKKVFEYLEQNINSNSVVYYNYKIHGKEFDFCLVLEGLGVLVIEVKSWNKSTIKKIADRSNIFLEVGGKDYVVRSPEDQARSYAKELWKESRKVIGVNIPIIPVVWFTELSKKDFFDKELDITCFEELTLFKEDFNENDFMFRLESIFESSLSYNDKRFAYFNDIRMYKFRTIFESKKGLEDIRKIPNENSLKDKRQYYSILYVSKEIDKDKVLKLIDFWETGTKIYLIIENLNTFNIIKNEIKRYLESRNLNKKLKVLGDNIKFYGAYNFSMYISTEIEEEVILYDGVGCEEFKEYLMKLDEESYFNMGQYLVEHGDLNKNISVKAGAGTGKTYTMISRIMYLIYKKNYTPDELENVIALITFTRDAADSMKKKLEAEFIQYYLLTRDVEFIDYIERVNDMNISTIHSLIKKLLNKYGYILGHGNDIRISSGVIDRRKEIEKEINRMVGEYDYAHLYEYLKKINYSEEDIKLILNTYYGHSIYDIIKLLEELLNKMDSFNIDASKEELNYGTATEIKVGRVQNEEFNKGTDFPMVDLILNQSVKNIIVNTNIKLKKENKVSISQLIIKLDELLKNIESEDLIINRLNIEYLFIDEFQDTDNKQIELILFLNKYINFKLFVVGDIKQCIYRFRGADEEAFDEIKKDNEKSWIEYSLNKNYRTNKYILEEFHKVFYNLGKNNLLPYSKENRLYSGTGKLVSESIKNISIKNDFEEVFLENIKLEYKKLMEKGNNGSIGILVRENKQVQEIVTLGNKYREELGFIIENPGVGNLYSIEPTIDLYKLVISLLYNKEPSYLLNLYDTNYVNSSYSAWDLYCIRRDNDSEETIKNLMYEHILKTWPLKNWEKYIERLKEETTLMVLRDIIYELKPWTNYSKEFKNVSDLAMKSKAHEYKDNLDLLFEKIIENSNIDYMTLSKLEDFLRIMITTGVQENTRLSQNLDDKITVTCSTVHKAKGLEYDTVILPYTNLVVDQERLGGKFIIDKNTIGYKSVKKLNNIMYILTNDQYSKLLNLDRISQQKEEIRILYVALTRVKDRLILFDYHENDLESLTWQGVIDGLYR